MSKTIIVFDVPAENGGALSILQDFYNEAKLFDNKNINWIFVVSKPVLKETENIKVLRFPSVKKSWFHRQYFDMIVAPHLVRKYNANKIFSLQNMIIPFTKIKQTLYVHQPLPFVDYKFSLRENKLFWIYQNIIGKKIIKSIKKSDKLIVQTKWMKNACINQTGIKENKVIVIPPDIHYEFEKQFNVNNETMSTFFYPASAMLYKNHELILKACKLLAHKKNLKYKVLFTLYGNENKHITEIFNTVKEENLPIEFVGNLSRSEVFKKFTETILVFPSYIETFGLPLLEARMHKGIILASNCDFSNEILNGYNNAYFFDPFNVKELENLMIKILQKEIQYNYLNVNEKVELGTKKLISYIV